MVKYIFSKFTRDLCKIRHMIAFGFTTGAIANLMEKPVEYVEDAVYILNEYDKRNNK